MVRSTLVVNRVERPAHLRREWVASHIARFRHPRAVMPHAMDGEGEVSGFRRLGPLGPGVELMFCGAPKDGAEEYRLSRRMRCQLSRIALVGWRLLEQEPKSQATSRTCSVGPSSLMNASDLNAPVLRLKGTKSSASGALSLWLDPPIVEMACLSLGRASGLVQEALSCFTGRSRRFIASHMPVQAT